MIKLTGINKIYRTNEIETVALENVNLEVNKGEFLSIMGPSGCGKSTLLNIMGLLDAPTSGTIEIAGTKVDGMKDKELAAFRNQKLGFVFQSFHLINSLNVMDNVELPLLYRRIGSGERKRLAKEVLEKVGLSHRMNHFPTQLSGGQKQRLCIARALLKKPKILILDDSTSAVDTATDAKIRQAFATEIPDTTKIIIAQRVSSIEDADQIIVLDDGKIIGVGTSEELLKTNDIYREVYESQVKGGGDDE